MNRIYWAFQLVENYIDFYFKIYPKLIYYKLRLYLNEVFNRTFYFIHPLPVLHQQGMKKEYRRLYKLDTQTRIRYLRYHAEGSYWSFRISVLFNHSELSPQDLKKYQQYNAALIFRAEYFKYLWYQEKEAAEALEIEKFC